MIDIDGVSLSFGDACVLSGVELAADRGELVGLVGPNGAGKTTLLRTVNGLLDPGEGTVRVDGDRVSDLDARAVGRRVATVPQDTHLQFAFTVEQVVEMGRTPHRSRLDWQDATAAVDRALERTETAALADRPVDEISGGERQRVLLARALAQEAPVLVLDEPTASLDVNHQVRVLELVRGLVDDGRTALAAIHDLDLAARYCDRLALLADGEIVATGPPESVLTDDRVTRVFGTAAAVTEDELTGTPRLTAVGSRPDRDCRVHVVGGGRQAARALGACWRAGFDVSVGVVPTGDVAATRAEDLGVPAVTTPPFAPVDAPARERAADLIARADVVVRTAADLDPVTGGLLSDTTTVVDWEAAADDPSAIASSTARRETEVNDPLDDPQEQSATAQNESGVVAAVLAAATDSATGDD